MSSGNNNRELKKVLGLTRVILLGVGALLGGGIFTILGTTIGIAGTAGALVALAALAVGLLGIVAIYAELGTAFPEAGGGYLWVREGLGDLQGFISGWLSWFAHAAAAGLYALSFGFYAREALGLLGVSFPDPLFRIGAAITALLLLAFLNWRGISELSRVTNIIVLGVLAVLFVVSIAGTWATVTSPERITRLFQDGFPTGLIGVLGAMSFFFIAFEGSEIQTQAAEEMKNPAKDLPRALFYARAIITILYLFVAGALIIGFPAGGGPLYAAIGTAGENALPMATRALIPAFGIGIIILGGLFVNLAAINATIFSSSHVVLAMGRARHVLQGLAAVHERNRTPHRAIFLSTFLIILLVIFLPLKEVASLADFLFLLLFLQVVFAFLAFRRRKPQITRPFKMAASPAWPLFTAVLLIVLGVVLVTHVSPLAGVIGVFWLMLGLVNYFAYATPMEQQELEEATTFSHAWKTGGLAHYHILVPIAKEVYAPELFELAIALAKQREDPEIIALEINEIRHRRTDESDAAHVRVESLLTKLVERGREARISTDGKLFENVEPIHAILGVIAQYRVNLLILGWDGYARQGTVFSAKVDMMLREVRCDTLVVKLSDLSHLKRVLVCLPPDEAPHVRYMGKVASSLARAFGGSIDVVTIMPQHTPLLERSKVEQRIRHWVNRMKLGMKVEPRFIFHSSPVDAILALEETHDTIIMGAGRERFFREMRRGSIAEQVAKRTKKTAIIVRGYQGILPPFWQYLRERT